MKTALYALMALALLGIVQATDSVITGDDQRIGSYGIYQAEYCFTIGDESYDVEAVVETVCEDLNGVYGCQAGDRADPEEFEVTAREATTGADGCVTLDLKARGLSNNPYYYVVGGSIGGARVGSSEAGRVSLVPEMGVVGWVLVVTGAVIIAGKAFPRR